MNKKNYMNKKILAGMLTLASFSLISCNRNNQIPPSPTSGNLPSTDTAATNDNKSATGTMAANSNGSSYGSGTGDEVERNTQGAGSTTGSDSLSGSAPTVTGSSNTTNAANSNLQISGSKDTEITRLVRQDLMDEDALSVYAKNIKIVTRNGQVTVSGPVRSEDERNTILRNVRNVAGVSKVVNKLEVISENN